MLFLSKFKLHVQIQVPWKSCLDHAFIMPFTRAFFWRNPTSKVFLWTRSISFSSVLSHRSLKKLKEILAYLSTWPLVFSLIFKIWTLPFEWNHRVETLQIFYDEETTMFWIKYLHSLNLISELEFSDPYYKDYNLLHWRILHYLQLNIYLVFT